MTGTVLVVRMLGALALVACYFLTLWSFGQTPFFQSHFGTVSSPLFAWIQYLWWIPFAIAIHRLVWRHLWESLALRALVFAVLFAPGLMGIYRVVWLVPAYSAFGFALLRPSPAMLAWVIVTSGIPILVFWVVAYATLSVARRQRRDTPFKGRGAAANDRVRRSSLGGPTKR